MPINLFAQTYTTLWKHYEAASGDDLPKTQQEVLKTIIKKAEKEREYGHLLKAQLCYIGAVSAVTPDSLEMEVERLKDKELAARDNNPVLAAVYQSVLGGMYANNHSLDENHNKISRDYYKQSLSHPELLVKAKADGYVPLVETGSDSKYFDHDLFSVLCFEAKDYERLHQYYSEVGNRQAACLSACYLLRQQVDNYSRKIENSKYLQRVDSLIDLYKDLDVAGELAILRYEFMARAHDRKVEDLIGYLDQVQGKWKDWKRTSYFDNARMQLTQPKFSVDFGPRIVRPTEDRVIKLNDLRNLQSLTMRISRVNVDPHESLFLSVEKDREKVMAAIVKDSVFEVRREFAPHLDYKVFEDSVVLQRLPLGVYLAEFESDFDHDLCLFYVSDVYVITQPLPQGKSRYLAVSATTGHPLPNAKIYFAKYRSDERKVYSFDKHGELIIGKTESDNTHYFYATHGKDTFCPDQSLWTSSYSYTPYPHLSVHTQVLTDRSIYRPGQTVHVALMKYRSINGLECSVDAGDTIRVSLLDANDKMVEEKDVVTDEFGKATLDFILPTKGLTGRFTISTYDGSTNFRVEEYKRPTFEVEMPYVKEAYKNGDTLHVTGKARTYSGVPVQGADVHYTVKRTEPKWWWYLENNDNEDVLLLEETVKTDNQGNFSMTIPIVAPVNKLDADYVKTWAYDIEVEAIVTDVGGESHSGQLSLPLTNKRSAFSFSMPSRVERRALKPVTFNLKDLKGENVEGKVTYTIDNEGKSYTVDANKPIELPVDGALARSGKHTITAVCNGDTVKREFILFSVDDKRPCIETDEWFYLSDNNFDDDNSIVDMQLGTSERDIYVVYNVFSENKVLEQGSFKLDNSNYNRKWRYKEEYGTGVLVTFAWVRDGVMHTVRETISRPMPDKRILLSWETFRDKLTPGDTEQWILKATYPDGTPADAQMMATVYDHSLDQIASHYWSLRSLMGVRLPYTRWSNMSVPSVQMNGSKHFVSRTVPRLNMSHIKDGITEFHAPRMYYARGGARGPMVYDVRPAPMAHDENIVGEEMAAQEAVAEVDAMKAAVAVSSEETQDNDSQDAQQDVQLRENLNETAAFIPQARTDAQGRISLVFTLPEAVTTWRMMGIATDKEVNHGYISAMAVAQKDIMVIPNVPRFVRQNDKAQLSARIFNTTDKAIKGNAKLQILDAETENVVVEKVIPFAVEAQQTTGVTFDYAPDTAPGLMVCRVMAYGDGFSDGEQHYLPILPSRELITHTVPFTQHEAQVTTFDLKKLFPKGSDQGKLTIEYTNNPVWLMIQALPSMAVADSKNAITQAVGFYANTLGKHIMELSPNIKETVAKWNKESLEQGSLTSNLEKNEELKDLLLNETPWVGKANEESEQKRNLAGFFDENLMSSRIDNQLTMLGRLQNGDGSWSWFEGMEGSPYITAEVAELFVRLNHLAGTQEATSNMLSAAMNYLGHELIKEVEYIKKYKLHNSMPSETAMQILYTFALDGRQQEDSVKKAADFLVSLFEKKSPKLSIYGKARSAVILSYFGRNKTARTYLESVEQYSVVTEEMGRYFDTRKAQYSWRSYNIPTEVAAIEAFKMLKPTEVNIVDEMRKWLLQQKRTQMWDTPVNSADAVYAFLHGHEESLDNGVNSTITIDGEEVKTSEATAGLGYVKAAMNPEGKNTLKVDKTSTGTSWGAIYAQYMQDATAVDNLSSGIKVTREIRSDKSELHVGDKVTVRITVKTERDYDFVEVIDRRAACMEPVSQLSGYHFGYYIAPKDYTTTYYFHKMPKGTFVIEAEYYIDRAGTYDTGTCKVQCAYAPEYSATGKALTFEVK